jgi:hypothetical protein
MNTYQPFSCRALVLFRIPFYAQSLPASEKHFADCKLLIQTGMVMCSGPENNNNRAIEISVFGETFNSAM